MAGSVWATSQLGGRVITKEIIRRALGPYSSWNLRKYKVAQDRDFWCMKLLAGMSGTVLGVIWQLEG